MHIELMRLHPLTRTYAPVLTFMVQSPIIEFPMRGRAEVARRAHNPEVSGSNPLPAIEKEPEYAILWFFVSRAYRGCQHFRIGGFNNEPLFAGLKKLTYINSVVKSYRWFPHFQDSRGLKQAYDRLL